MNTNEDTREILTQERLHSEKAQENILERATEALHPVDELDEAARELLTKQRLAAEQREQAVLERAKEDL